ncbi:MAG: MmgE/PrpD family protein [Acidobacteriota bacterium]
MPLTRKQFLRLASRGAAASVAACSLPAAALAEASQQSGQQAATRTPARRPPTRGVTSAVCAFIADAAMERFPSEAIREGKRCLVDGFGVILGGATAAGSRILREFVAQSGGRGEATVLGPEPLRAPAAFSALANAASGHAMDFDDTQLSSSPDRIFGLLTHPTVPALSAALAVGETLGVSGRTLLEAYLVGVEVECKIAEAIEPDHYKRGFHSSGTIGVFGAVASAAKLLKLDRSATMNAVGMAASMGSGIRVNFGTMTKPLHVGRAAENGVVAAMLAAKGFTAAADALDGEWGFFQVLGGGADPARILTTLGAPFSIVDPGVSFKPYPCGSLGQPTMDAMLKLVVDHDVRPEQVEHVVVRAGSNILNPLRYKTAATELEAKFCLPFMMSAIVIRRRAGIREFADAFVASPDVQAMMARVETVFDPGIEAQGFEHMRSRIDVRLNDGRLLTQASDDRYRGGPERPFTTEELRQKFADNAELFLSKAHIDRGVALIESIETLKDIGTLVGALNPR